MKGQDLSSNRLPLFTVGSILFGCAALLTVILNVPAVSQKNDKAELSSGDKMGYNKLTPDEERVIVHKGTERPFSGKFNKTNAQGEYLCRRCNAVLYKSEDKFASDCGWPSFDDAVSGAVREKRDADGRRTEILCANCDGHLGHVFLGEGHTDKNVRHCVNSISMRFVAAEENIRTARAYFAGGCFWGVEHYLEKADGVVAVISGYMGGSGSEPSYEQVCSGTSGHAETVEVMFDPTATSFEQLARLFFEIHDPTEVDRQGPDIGSQYRSAIFYVDDEQKEIAARLISTLKESGYAVATRLEQARSFWPAEEYHQDYYSRTGQQPYCHIYQKRF